MPAAFGHVEYRRCRSEGDSQDDVFTGGDTTANTTVIVIAVFIPAQMILTAFFAARRESLSEFHADRGADTHHGCGQIAFHFVKNGLPQTFRHYENSHFCDTAVTLALFFRRF